MSLDRLNPTLAQGKRLAALGMLANVAKIEFRFIADHLGLSDSDLSKQMRALVDAGYVASTKTGKGPSRKTWFAITRKGKVALQDHIDALNALVLDSLPPPG